MRLSQGIAVLIVSAAAVAQTPADGGTQGVKAALRAHDFAHAAALSSAQLKQTPGDFKLWTLQGIAFGELHREKDALASFNHALAISPDYLPALEGAAQLEYQTESPRAAQLLNRILKQQPNDPTSHAMLAALAFKHHDCPSAAKHFAQAGDLMTDQPAALGEYAACLMELQRPDDAVPVFKQIVTLAGQDPRPRYDLAVAQLDAHQEKDALETLQPLLSADNPDPDVLDLAASAYEAQGNTPKAVELLHRAIVADPGKVRYYLDFATISFNHQSFQVGVDMLNVGLQKMPNEASLYVARGILYIQLSQYEKGEADFQTATRLDPAQTSGAVAQGMAQIQQSNLDDALSTVKAQLKSHPQDAFLHYLKAQILMQKGSAPGTAEFTEAIAAANRAVELKPDFALPRDILGSLYLKSKQFNLAVVQCRLALKANPSDQEALYHLIQALRESGKGSQPETAELVKRLAGLRQESRNAEASSNRYKLFEPGKPENSPQQ
jgi:tetratricopeptide (TPR) repeat protein